MSTAKELYNELAYYTLAHPDPTFIHQHVVDAFAVQQADDTTKPIAVFFGLVGLYLHVDRAFTGRQVQLAHMQLAKKRKQWPRMELPEKRGDITISDVIATDAGAQRDQMIDQWCKSVWERARDAKRQSRNC